MTTQADRIESHPVFRPGQIVRNCYGQTGVVRSQRGPNGCMVFLEGERGWFHPSKIYAVDDSYLTFKDECFRNWLNRVDARMGYDERRKAGDVAAWRKAFDLGWTEDEAIDRAIEFHQF